MLLSLTLNINYNFIKMGQAESNKNIQEEFQIYQVHENGDTLLKSKKDNKDYFMRVVTCTSQADLDRLKALLQSRAQLKSHHLLSLVEIKQKHQDFICSIHYKMYLVLQYSFKSAAQQIKERSKGNQTIPFQQSDIWSILYSCCSALQSLYSHGTSHECLTSEQIFISTDGFVKISQPLLFGLEKNHLQAMRTKQLGKVQVHLSPQIMNCLQDQNFFYYDKQKSDIFILGMIIIDLALLQSNILYDAVKKKANLDTLPGLLKRVGEKYSQNLTSILAQMLRIESTYRPTLSQIIQKVQKCNNVGEEFTLQTQSNLKSNQIQSEQGQQRFMFQKPAKYKTLQIKEELLFSQQSKPKQVEQKVLVRVDEQPSLSIKQQNSILNQHNFDGRVFATTPHQINYLAQASNQVNVQKYNLHPQPHIITHNVPIQRIKVPPSITNVVINPNPQPVDNLLIQQQPLPIQKLPSQIQQSPPLIQHVQAQTAFQKREQQITRNLQTFKKQFNLYQRSRSIDSIKVTSNDFSTVSHNKQKMLFSATKVNAFAAIETKNHLDVNLFKNKQFEQKKSLQPIFTYQIPQVYNLMVKNTNFTQKNELFTNQDRKISIEKDKERVSTPQFQGQIQKLNRFSNLKNFQHQVISRFGDQSENSTFQALQLRKNVSQTQSQTHQIPKSNFQFHSISKQFQSPNIFPSNITFNNLKNSNPFTSSTPFPVPKSPFQGSNVGQNKLRKDEKTPFNVGSSVSYTFSPSKIDFSPKKQSFTCRSGFTHLNQFHNEYEDLQLQYVKQDIPQRGRYQGYKGNGERNGHGTLYFKDGGHYEGQWKNDKMHGFGKLFYQNGTIAYQGHWQNDQFNGQGRVYNMQPVSFQQQFNFKDFSQLGNKWVYYQGQFKNDSKHGKGYIKLTNGEMFQGLFDHDMIQGNGIFYKRTGQIVIGFWIDNKLFLNQSFQPDKK